MQDRQPRTAIIARHGTKTSSRSHLVLIVGALAATVLGGVAGLEFDRIAAIGLHLLHPAGQDALLRAAATAGLTGFLVWVACALVVRAISAIALKPYRALADRLERLLDGEIDDLADLHGPVVGVRRLARAIFVFHDRAVASQRSEAVLQARYDALYHEHAAERRVLVSALTGGLASAVSQTMPPFAHAASASGFNIPDFVAAGGASEVSTPHAVQVIDPTGQMTHPERRTERSDSPPLFDLGALDMAVVGR